jgi:hypothetical protein
MPVNVNKNVNNNKINVVVNVARPVARPAGAVRHETSPHHNSIHKKHTQKHLPPDPTRSRPPHFQANPQMQQAQSQHTLHGGGAGSIAAYFPEVVPIHNPSASAPTPSYFSVPQTNSAMTMDSVRDALASQINDLVSNLGTHSQNMQDERNIGHTESAANETLAEEMPHVQPPGAPPPANPPPSPEEEGLGRSGSSAGAPVHEYEPEVEPVPEPEVEPVPEPEPGVWHGPLNKRTHPALRQVRNHVIRLDDVKFSNEQLKKRLEKRKVASNLQRYNETTAEIERIRLEDAERARRAKSNKRINREGEVYYRHEPSVKLKGKLNIPQSMEADYKQY